MAWLTARQALRYSSFAKLSKLTNEATERWKVGTGDNLKDDFETPFVGGTETGYGVYLDSMLQSTGFSWSLGTGTGERDVVTITPAPIPGQLVEVLSRDAINADVLEDALLRAQARVRGPIDAALYVVPDDGASSGSGSGSAATILRESPTGVKDGSNKTFTLSHVLATDDMVFVDGALSPGASASGLTLTTVSAPRFSVLVWHFIAASTTAPVPSSPVAVPKILEAWAWDIGAWLLASDVRRPGLLEVYPEIQARYEAAMEDLKAVAKKTFSLRGICAVRAVTSTESLISDFISNPRVFGTVTGTSYRGGIL